MIWIWKWGQFVCPVVWWQKGSGKVRPYFRGYMEFKLAAKKGWWSLPKRLTANRWCPLPKWTNGIKQPWFSKKHAQTHWSCQGKDSWGSEKCFWEHSLLKKGRLLWRSLFIWDLTHINKMFGFWSAVRNQDLLVIVALHILSPASKMNANFCNNSFFFLCSKSSRKHVSSLRQKHWNCNCK